MDSDSADADWELLNNSEAAGDDESPISDPYPNDGVVRHDYFSLDSRHKYADPADVSDHGSVGSENPSWIDPGSDEAVGTENSADQWSESGDVAEVEADQFAIEEAKAAAEEEKEEVVIAKEAVAAAEGTELIEGGKKEEEKRTVVWWKVPFELVRCCVMRAGPVWSVSVAAAAAVMGFVILGRRLYRMKKKATGLQVKVASDEKKVSQLISHAARLNEAFSMVRRVPIIRPPLPSQPGLAPWPVMSLR